MIFPRISPSKSPPLTSIELEPPVEAWLDRIELYGDEHAIGPGGIDSELKNRTSTYKDPVRNLPGPQKYSINYSL